MLLDRRPFLKRRGNSRVISGNGNMFLNISHVFESSSGTSLTRTRSLEIRNYCSSKVKAIPFFYFSHLPSAILKLSLSLTSERRRISGCRLSSPKNNVCELEPGNDFRDVASFVFSSANQIMR